MLAGLADRIDLLIDAGPTMGGLESTVLDVTVHPPRLLRPGLVTIAELETLLGPIERTSPEGGGELMRSPGQMRRHYARVRRWKSWQTAGCASPNCAAKDCAIGWLTHRDDGPTPAVRILLPDDAAGYSAQTLCRLAPTR